MTATPVGNMEMNKATIGPPEVLRSARHLKTNKEGNVWALVSYLGCLHTGFCSPRLCSNIYQGPGIE